jgi:hypothetical protein
MVAWPRGGSHGGATDINRNEGVARAAQTTKEGIGWLNWGAT